MSSVEEVWITGLYGEFDHRVSLDPDWPFAIVYGPNGIGKTRFFGTIFALGKLKPRALSGTPFDEAGIRYSDGATLEVRRDETEGGIKLKFCLHDKDSSPARLWEWPPDYDGLSARERQSLRRETRGKISFRWKDQGDGTWVDSMEDEVVTDSELEAITGIDLEELPENRPPGYLAEFVAKRPIYFVETQRLLVQRRRNDSEASVGGSQPRQWGSKRAPLPEDMVSRYARDLKGRLNRALIENSRQSQELDRSFPTRLLNENLQESTVAEETIRFRHTQQNDKRARLVELGLTPESPTVELPAGQLDGLKLSVLNLYLDDSDAKLSSFDDMLQRVSLLRSIVNRRFLRKRLDVNAEDGLSIASLSGEDPLDPTMLSSGEKHELIMFYDMIFSASNSTLVLIDEPEISLHVSWQRQFLSDIAEVSKLTGVKALIATHSPQIIGNHRDKTTELGSVADVEAMGH